MQFSSETDQKNEERFIAEQFVLNTDKNVFLTGKAGTGKTTLLKSLIDQTDKNTIVVAPTGVAAINAGGVTIHSLFQLPTTAFIPTHEITDPERFTDRHTLATRHRMSKEKRQLLTELELLIIDEISMVRADLLDAIDFTLRRIRKKSLPFGGVQVFVIGDMYQLSPVIRSATWNVLNKYYQSPFFFDSQVWKESNAITIELKIVYRQEDQTFVDILNHIRHGEVILDDLERLNSRYNEKIENRDVITLTTHNAKADKINSTELNSLKGKSYHLKAELSGTFPESAYPLTAEIHVKKGARIMFVRNHQDGLYFNGKIGEVTGMFDENLFVKCEGDREPIAIERSEWKNNKYTINQETKEIEIKEIGSYKQYPIQLAWAVTVHKSQGLTFDNMIVDLEDIFLPGQLYVGLSRCRSLEGLTLSSKIKPENIRLDTRIKAFHDSIALSDDINEELSQSMKLFDQKKIATAFSVDKLIAYTDMWDDSLREKESPHKNAFLKTSTAIKMLLNDLQKTADKFHGQIRHICSIVDQDISNDQKLVDRLQKGIAYFSEQIHSNAIVLLEEKYDEFKKAKSSLLVKNLRFLLSEYWRYVNHLYDLTYNGRKIYINQARIKQVVHFNPQKKSEKRVKGQTYEETFSMWDKGLSIEEIASKRDMATSTIESHMGKLLKDEKIKIGDLLKKDRIDKIYPFFAESKGLDLNDIKAKIPFFTSYAELRWMKIWFQLVGLK